MNSEEYNQVLRVWQAGLEKEMRELKGIRERLSAVIVILILWMAWGGLKGLIHLLTLAGV